MEKPIFDLLIEISKNDFIDNEDKSRTTNRDKEIARAEKQRQLTYLVQQGLISHTKDIYMITEYGYHVSQFKSWNDYLNHQKALIDKRLKKENADLKISEFQARTKLLPYFLSLLSIIISIIAIFDPFKIKADLNEFRQKENPERNILSDTISPSSLIKLDTIVSEK